MSGLRKARSALRQGCGGHCEALVLRQIGEPVGDRGFFDGSPVENVNRKELTPLMGVFLGNSLAVF